MNNPTQPTPPRQLSSAYWLRSKLPVSELHQKNCLLRIHDGAISRDGIFKLDARAHGFFPQYHQITATYTVYYTTRGITELITFDQHRADQIERAAGARDDYAFIAEIDIRRPLQYVSDIQEDIEHHLMEALTAIDERHTRQKT